MAEAIEPPGHRLVLLGEMETMLDAFFSDVASARREVAVSCYIVLDDRLGRALGERLVAAVRRGLRARLLYDPLGSKEAHRSFFRSLQARGVEVRAWRKLNSVPALRHLAPRDHSRIFLADDVGYTGGAAFSDCWLPRAQGGQGWHDVCCRAEGPVVEHFWRLFERRWDEADPDSRDPRDFDSGDELSQVRLVADTPNRQSPLFHLHCEAFARARSRIWIENAYFVPPPSMQRVLREAARRGVDVRVILPAVSDLAALKHAALADAASWIADGMRVFEYRPTMLHSKVSLVDDRWASVGTFNFNSTSVGLANEVNLIVRDRAFNAALARHMENDLAHCGEVTIASLSRRHPLARALDRGARALVSIWDLLWGPRAALRSPAGRLRAGPCPAGEAETHKLQAAPR